MQSEVDTSNVVWRVKVGLAAVYQCRLPLAQIKVVRRASAVPTNRRTVSDMRRYRQVKKRDRREKTAQFGAGAGRPIMDRGWVKSLERERVLRAIISKKLFRD